MLIPTNTGSLPSAVPRRWALNFSERKVLLATIDMLCVTAALAMAISWRFGQRLTEALASHPNWYLILAGVWLAASLLLGAYDLRRASRLKEGVATGAVTSLAVAIIYLLIPYVTPALPTSRLSLMIFFGAMVGTVAAWRAVYALVLVRPGFRRRALVVGAGWAGETIVNAIARQAPAEYEVVGLVDDQDEKQGRIIGGLSVLGTHGDLRVLVARTSASDVIVAITEPGTMHPGMFQAIMDCHEDGVSVVQMHALFEQLTGRVPVEHAGRNLHVVLPVDGYSSQFQRVVKRTFDIFVGCLGLVLTHALLPLVWLVLRMEGVGPVFYRQTRVGQGARHFELVKFRTMKPNAEANGPQWTEENDGRITPTGRFLRRLHLDEVPQAINILRGDLSFIGPRPERPEFVAQLETQIPFYRARHAVRPGITGWAQVNYRYGSSVEDALIKLQYDLYYIKHQSIWLDLLILAKTVGTVLTMRGR